MAIKISVRNLNRDIRINLKAVKKIAKWVLTKEFSREAGSRHAKTMAGKKKNADLGITFVNNATMKRLNYRFKKKRYSTDVLSFSYGEDLADIVISAELARANSRRFNTSFKKEIILYIIHGILHYVGFKDSTKKAKSVMKKKEQKILERLWKNAHSSAV